MQSPQPHQAEVIAFPARPAPAAELDQGSARLAAALANLLQALDEQRAAVGAWRASLGELKQSVDKLGHSLGGYRTSLAVLADGVDRLNHQARTLEAISAAP